MRAVDVAPLPPLPGWYARGWHGARAGPQIRIWNPAQIRNADTEGFSGEVREKSGGGAAAGGGGGGGARTQAQELILTHKGFVFLGRFPL